MTALSVVVTGAASGIGFSTASAFARQGWSVVCVDRDADRLGEVTEKIGGHSVCGSVASDETAVAAVAAAASSGQLSAVCNIAGINPPGCDILSVTDEQWDEVMRINVRAIIHLARYAVPAMAAGGTIINMASVHAFASLPGTAPYAASKGAVVALTRQLAVDLASRRIRVVAVAPGAVDTPMSATAAAHAALAIDDLGFPRAQDALGRMADPSEVAEVVLWLASGAASFINGTTLVADGGLLAKLWVPDEGKQQP